ncbi:YafY family protein [Tersicoccus sp. Bi-70]|uniref:helix-turn-helix transcriptional regulator n=1 Tax=Tersicoccus sp. Bi-70 TaxID=1897634 RepID=UPI0009783063|nr:WYL domain-containing protein [Tersicoccus sp. Bi-70]OMH36939.1 transcriptional regulator [Tersicoccus sp. Bi-70]
MSGTSGRLLSLLSLLQARRDWPGRLLAERLEVSERTVRRDVDRLRDLGYPVRATMGPDGGYRLEAGAELPPLLFDDDQAVAIALALHIAATSGAADADAAWRALTTVRQVMPARLRRRIDAVQVLGMPHADARPGQHTDTSVLLAVTDAAHAHEQLRFDYRTVDDGTASGETGDESAVPATRPPRRVEPHHVLHRGGRWYLLAWDVDRGDWRTFRVDRMTGLRTPTGPRFRPREVPGGDVVAFVEARFRGQADPAAGSAWPCRGTVIARLPATEAAPYLPDGAVEALDAQTCRVRMGAWSWPGLAASFAQLDADVEVVEPPDLVEAFRDLARRAATAGRA